MNTKKITYYISLGLFTIIILFSVWNYLFNFSDTLSQMEMLGYPEHLIHPLAIAQTLGIIILVLNKGGWLINWVYAGFFYNLIFAIIAHYATHEGNGAPAVICLILLCVSYVLNKQLKNQSEIKEKNLKLI